MNWNSRTTDTIIYHETFLQNPIAFFENPTIVEDSKVYHAMLLVRSVVSFLDDFLRSSLRDLT